MRNEQLMPQNFMTINTKTWEEMVSTDRGFITMDYLVRIDFFNIPNRERNPEYTWAIMAPPTTGNPLGVAKVTKLDTDFSGFVLMNTGNQERIENAFKLLDWMYSDEAYQLLSWGKEGETYKTNNGEREFILNEGGDPRSKYGVTTYGLYTRLDPIAADCVSSKEQAKQVHTAENYIEENTNPTRWLALNDEESQVATGIKDELDTFVKEQLSKFLLGQRPMFDWDTFKKDPKGMNVDKLLEIYSEA